jgi:hypothetical protein
VRSSPSAPGPASPSTRPGIVTPTEADIDDYLARAGRGDTLFFLICRREDGAIAGVANVSQIVRANARGAYLGYYALEPFAVADT